VKRFILAVSFLACAAIGGNAEEVIGNSILNGRNVKLLDNFTWRYDDSPVSDSACQIVISGLSFCGDREKWRPVSPSTSEMSAMFRYDDRTYGMFIFEQLGQADGLSLKFMSDTVISTFATAAKTTVKAVKIYDSQKTEFQGIPAMRIVYGGAIGGVPVVYDNTFIVFKKTAVQLATYTIGADYSDVHKRLHEEFVTNTKVE
jgi:hypothetical protein